MSYLVSAGVPDYSRQPITLMRANILGELEKAGREFKREGGISILENDARQTAEDYLAALKAYGIFLFPDGELEGWLPDLSIAGHGPNWLIPIFESMGEDPTSGSYLRPSNGDVWEFIDQLSSWFSDPQRKGIPA